MLIAATELTGWWIGYAIAVVVIALVAILLLVIASTAHKIGDVAKDITQSLAETRDRTEVLWQVDTTNAVATDILTGAITAREALGGGTAASEQPAGATGAPREALAGDTASPGSDTERAQDFTSHSLPTTPIDEEVER
jgi:hypothetical protein